MAEHHEDEARAADFTPASRSMVESSACPPSRYPYRDSGDEPTGEPDANFDFRYALSVLNKRKWVIAGVVATCAVLGLLKALIETPLYTATIRLQIDRSAPQIIKGGDVEQQPTDASDYGTEIELLRSLSLAERVASMTHLGTNNKPATGEGEEAASNTQGGGKHADQEGAAVAILNAVVVKPIGGTRLVDISYTSRDPAQAQQIANAYGEAYSAANLDKRFQANAYAKSFLEDQLKQLKLRLEGSEKALLAFAEREQIVATNDKGSVAESNLAAANSALGSIIAERMKNEQLWRQAERAAGIEMPQILTNKAIEDLRNRRSQITTEYQEKLETFRPDYPAMVQLANRIKEIDHQIGIEVKAIKSSLKAAYDASFNQENEMKQRIEKLRIETLDLQKRSIEYNILKREVDTTRSLYESLLQRYKEVDVASGVGANRVFIIDKARLPVTPSSPNTPKTLLVAVALGVALGVVSAFALEKFDDLIYSPDDAEAASGLALIGVIPKAKEGLTFEVDVADQRSRIAEAFRSACMSLQLSTESGVPKTLAITSAAQAEGKTSTAIGIARQFAAIGLKVLLVDADLRRPTLHLKLGIENDVGLSTYLTNHCAIHEALRKIDPALDLHVITSGPLPPNPVELLHGPSLASLLSTGGEVFDLVLIDAPPAWVADTLLLSSMAKATLFVIASGEGRTGQVRYALKRLAQARVRPLGLMLTKYDGKTGNYGFEYGYGDAYLPDFAESSMAEPHEKLGGASKAARALSEGPAFA